VSDEDLHRRWELRWVVRHQHLVDELRLNFRWKLQSVSGISLMDWVNPLAAHHLNDQFPNEFFSWWSYMDEARRLVNLIMLARIERERSKLRIDMRH
jgi:hypothetical protein